jgi:hypothetical protein
MPIIHIPIDRPLSLDDTLLIIGSSWLRDTRGVFDIPNSSSPLGHLPTIQQLEYIRESDHLLGSVPASRVPAMKMVRVTPVMIDIYIHVL